MGADSGPRPREGYGMASDERMALSEQRAAIDTLWAALVRVAAIDAIEGGLSIGCTTYPACGVRGECGDCDGAPPTYIEHATEHLIGRENEARRAGTHPPATPTSDAT